MVIKWHIPVSYFTVTKDAGNCHPVKARAVYCV